MKYLKYIIESVEREFVTAHRCYYLYSIVLLYITYSYYLYINMCVLPTKQLQTGDAIM